MEELKELFKEMSEFRESKVISFSKKIKYDHEEGSDEFIVRFEEAENIFIDHIGPLAAEGFGIRMVTGDRNVQVLSNGFPVFNMDLTNKFIQIEDRENDVYIKSKDFDYDLYAKNEYEMLQYPIINSKIEKYQGFYKGVITCKVSYFIDEMDIYTSIGELNDILIDISYMINRFTTNAGMFNILMNMEDGLFIINNRICKVLSMDNNEIIITEDSKTKIKVSYKQLLDSFNSYLSSKDIFFFNNKWYNADKLDDKQKHILSIGDEKSSIFLKIQKLYKTFLDCYDSVIKKDLASVLNGLITEVKQSMILDEINTKQLVYVMEKAIYKYDANFIRKVEESVLLDEALSEI